MSDSSNPQESTPLQPVGPRRDFLRTAGSLVAGGVVAGTAATAHASGGHSDESEHKNAKAENKKTKPSTAPPNAFGVTKVVDLKKNSVLVTEILTDLPDEYDVHVKILPRGGPESAGVTPIAEGCALEGVAKPDDDDDGCDGDDCDDSSCGIDFF